MVEATNSIVSVMHRQFGQPTLRCEVCGKVQFGAWEYLKTGWPKHHGQTMRLENRNPTDEKELCRG